MPTWIDPSAQKGGSLDLLKPAPANVPAQQVVQPTADSTSIGRALNLLSSGRFDKYIGSKFLSQLEDSGFARAGRVDWNLVAGLFNRSDVASLLRTLVSRWSSHG